MSVIAVIYIWLFRVCFCPVESAQILAIFPYPGVAQYTVAEPYLKALAARGHNLTVISHFPQIQKVDNFTDVTLTFSNYEGLIKDSLDVDTSNQMDWYLDFVHNVTLKALNNEDVRNLMMANQTFDLVITEVMLTEALYAIAPYLRAQLIGISSFGTDQNIDQLVGNISPVSYIPIPTSKLMEPMNFWQRLRNIKIALYERLVVSISHFKQQSLIYKQYFPQLPYELDSIMRNFSLVLLNQHFSVSFPRPYVPNMVEVGGMFINSTTNQLPSDIEHFVNKTEHDLIYFNMGPVAQHLILPSEKVDVFLRVFASLNVRVLWQFPDTEIPNKPPNVLIRKTLPHSSILSHPKVKLLIVHGDSISTIEAIHHGKPVVGVPFFFDQLLNMERVQHMGFGLRVDYKNLTEDALKSSILEILQNKTYTDTVQVISKRFHDQPMKPLDRAIYWTEYVLRHEGAQFMRAASRDLNFIQYYNFDALGFVVVIWTLFIAFIVRGFYSTFSSICFEIKLRRIRRNLDDLASRVNDLQH